MRSSRVLPRITSSRVVIVSGKGGVGKTTVAASLAVAAASKGSKVLLIEVEQRDGFAPLFHSKVDYVEREIGPNLTGLSVIPDEALVEYLHLFYGIKRVGRVLVTSHAIDFATQTAPGLRDILLIGKVKEAERRREDGRHSFDLLVVDAPPTGRLPRFLDAPRVVVDLVGTGAIRTQAQGVLDMLMDPKRCSVVLVTLPEDMPARETIEGAAAIAGMGIAVGPVVLNGMWPEFFTSAQEKALAKSGAGVLIEEAASAGVPMDAASAEALASIASAHARRVRSQRRVATELASELDLPRVTLPFLFTPSLGPSEVAALAGQLVAQGAV